jgi:hypothetical protein
MVRVNPTHPRVSAQEQRWDRDAFEAEWVEAATSHYLPGEEVYPNEDPQGRIAAGKKR